MEKKRKLKNYRISKKAMDNHKGVYNTLMIITFIPLIPFAILDKISELLEAIVQIVGGSRQTLVNNIFKLMYKNECNYYEDDED